MTAVPQRFDRERWPGLVFLGLALIAVTVLATARTRSELIVIDVASGRLRIERSFLGYRHASQPVESHLEWVGIELAGSVPTRWVTVSERRRGSLVLRGRYHRGLGQVHIDAFTLARLVHHDRSVLREELRRLATVEAEELFALRATLRAALAAARPPPP